MTSARKACGIPSNFEIKSFENDHFFSSVVEGLNNIRQKLQLNVKQLRIRCKNFVLNEKELVLPILEKRKGYRTIGDYCFNIEHTAEECEKLEEELPIIGQPDVEGQLICKLFKIQIHVLEKIHENTWRHQLVTEDDVKEIHSQKISYDNTNVIHIFRMKENEYQVAVRNNLEDKKHNTDKNANVDKKRGGTVDWGRNYEEGVLAHIAIQCALNAEVEDFELFNNVDGLGAFDDVVLKVKYGNGRDNEMYLFQIKHKDQKQVSIPNVFETPKGIFFLPKYQDSFNQINTLYNKDPNSKIFLNIKNENIKYVLFSNIKFDNKENTIKTNKYKFEKETDCSYIMKNFSTMKDVVPYNISNIEPSQQTDKFLSKCWVYPNQISANEMEELIGINLNNNIHPDKIKIILNCFAKWTRQKCNENVVKLDIVNLIFEHCLLHYDIPPLAKVNVTNYETIMRMLIENCFFPFINQKKLEVLRNSVLQQTKKSFGITVDATLLRQKINSKIIDNNTRIKELLIKRRKFYGSSRYLDLFYALYQTKELPMLLKFNDENENRIKFVSEKFPNYFQKRAFVLLYLNDPPYISNNLNVVTNFGILNEVTISLQGKVPQTLQSLIGNNEKVLKTISPNFLMDLLVNKTTVGEKPELIPYYVSRKIQTPLLQESVLKEPHCLFIFCDSNNLSIQEYINEYEKYQQTKYITFKYENVNVLDSNLPIENSFALLNKIEKSKHVLIKKDQYFHLIKSEGSVDVLRKHLVYEDEYVVKEENVLESVKNQANIICNTAGMGKTCLLQSIAKNAPPEKWTIYLNLNEHVNKLNSFNYSTQQEEIIEYLTESQITENSFIKELLLTRSKDEHVILLLDGYDEVPFKQFGEFIEWTTKMNINIYITTRPSKISELENTLGIFSSKMKHFDNEDQTEFLTQYYQKRNMEKEKIDSLIKKVEPYCKTFEANFIGIPLQTKMLAEVLVDSTEKNELDLIYLYDTFINKKIEELEEYKSDAYKIFCEKMSLSLFFTDEILKNCSEDLEAQIKQFKGTNKKDFIISGFTSENVPMFVHRTYAEYLAARFLYEKLTDKNIKNKKNWEMLQEKLYHIEMTDVRYFLDKIAAKNFPLHKSVLNNDIKMVAKLLNTKDGKKLCEETDELGRTAVELACSYGKRFDLDEEQDIVGLINLEKHVKINQSYILNNYKIDIPLIQQKFTIDVTILKLLIHFSNINTAPDCAFKTGSLEMLNCFPDMCQLKTLSQNKLKLLLYYCAVNNFSTIVQNTVGKNIVDNWFKKDHILDMFYNNEILTHIAAMRGNFEVCIALYKRGGRKKAYGKNILHVGAENGHTYFVEKLLNYSQKFSKQIDEKTDDYYSYTALHLAVKNGHLDVINLLLSKGANVNIKNESGENAVHLAYTWGNLKVVERLLQHDNIDANCVNEQDNNGNTILHRAFENGHLDIVNLLLLKGENVIIKNKKGENAVHLACSKGKIQVVERLLQDDKIDATYINEQDDYGDTLLHDASRNGYLDIVHLLLLKGANINIKNERGENSVHLAYLKGKLEVVERLLQHDKIDVNCINEQNSHGDTLLHDASANGYLDIINLLLLNGVDANLKNKNGENAVHLACSRGKIEAVERLLQDANYINEQDDCGETYLHHASRNGYLDIVNLLLSKGANIIIKNKNGANAVYLACCMGKIEVVERLLQHDKIDPNCINEQDNYGETLLHHASRNGYLDIVNLLLLKGANANIKNKKGENAVHLACLRGKIEVLEIILQHVKTDANYINEQDNYGKTLLHQASENGYLEIVKLLLLKGANVNIKNKKEENAVQLAYSRGKIEVVERLLQHDKIDANCVNEQDNEGNTFLHRASKNGHLNIVNLLILNGAGFNATNREGNTILHTIIQNTLFLSHSISTIKRILELNVELKMMKNKAGKTPLQSLQQNKSYYCCDDSNKRMYTYLEKLLS